MKIPVVLEPTSEYIHDNWYDWGDSYEERGVTHLVLRCRHDYIYYDLEMADMWCPDCENEHLNDHERLEYLISHFEEGDDR